MPGKRPPLAVLFSDEQIERFDRIAEALSARAAGTKITRSDAIRASADRGAAALETELGLTKRSKPKR
jgi:hypothetical protein